MKKLILTVVSALFLTNCGNSLEGNSVTDFQEKKIYTCSGSNWLVVIYKLWDGAYKTNEYDKNGSMRVGWMPPKQDLTETIRLHINGDIIYLKPAEMCYNNQ